jgi:hypothetical protein
MVEARACAHKHVIRNNASNDTLCVDIFDDLPDAESSLIKEPHANSAP